MCRILKYTGILSKLKQHLCQHMCRIYNQTWWDKVNTNRPGEAIFGSFAQWQYRSQ